jgi:hypothetical protein
VITSGSISRELSSSTSGRESTCTDGITFSNDGVDVCGGTEDKAGLAEGAHEAGLPSPPITEASRSSVAVSKTLLSLVTHLVEMARRLLRERP